MMNKRGRITSRPPGLPYQFPLHLKTPLGTTICRSVEPTRPQFSNQHKGTTNQSLEGKQFFDQRRTAGLCFRCGDKYQLGYSCSNRALNALQGVEKYYKLIMENVQQRSLWQKRKQMGQQRCRKWGFRTCFEWRKTTGYN